MFDTVHGSQLRSHITLLGWLVLGSGILGLFLTCSGTMLLAGIGLASGEPEARLVLPVIATMVALVPGVLSAISTAAGYGLLTRRSWGRPLALLDAALGLVWFPIGTLLGFYAFWVLFQKDAEAYFATGTDAERHGTPIATPGWEEPMAGPTAEWEGSVASDVAPTEPHRAE